MNRKSGGSSGFRQNSLVENTTEFIAARTGVDVRAYTSAVAPTRAWFHFLRYESSGRE